MNNRVLLITGLTLVLLVISKTNGAFNSGEPLPEGSDSNTEFKPFQYTDTETFTLNITFVGTGSTEDQQLSLNEDGSYHYITSNPNTLNILRIKINITGYTCWGNCSDTDLNSNRTGKEFTAGQIFLVYDGIVVRVGSVFTTSTGADIAMYGGTHVITFLYVGKDETNGFQMATDSVIIRVAETETELDEDGLNVIGADFSSSINDAAALTTKITTNTSYYDPGWETWEPVESFKPEASIDLSVGGTTHTDYDTISSDFDTSVLDISGSVNSSGFEALQIAENHTSTTGNIFIIDALGVRPLVDVSKIYAFDNTFVGIDCKFPCMNFIQPTYVGILVIADNGRWLKEAVEYSQWQDPFADFDGLNSIQNTTIVNSTTGEIDGGTILLDASFDFVKNVDGAYIWASSQTQLEIDLGSKVSTTCTCIPETTIITEITTITETGYTITETETTIITETGTTITDTSVDTEVVPIKMIPILISITTLGIFKYQKRKYNIKIT